MKKITLACLTALVLNSACTKEEKVLNIGFGSCNEPDQTQHLLPTLNTALDSLDYFIWLGDNIYLKNGQWNSYDSTMARYTSVFATPVFEDLLSKSHHLAIWDDHDAGPNDCDLSNFSGFPTTMRAFKDFWKPDYPQPNTKSYYGRKVLAEGQVDLFLLDNRSFRTHKDSANATVFGAEQLNWFQNALNHSTAQVHIICMGGQLLNTAKVFENMSNYPDERDLLLQWLSSSPGRPIVLTGDRHSGEINEIVISGTSILEVCASPLTANAHPHHDEKNSTRIHEKTTDTQHFGVLQLKLIEGKSSTLRVGLYNSNGTAIFSHRETL